MKNIRTEIIVQASAEKIWSILTGFEKYSEWNPFIKKISGERKLQARLQVFIQQEGQKGIEFTPVVQTYEPARELQWLGKLGISGLFDGRHSFKLVPLEQGRTLFIHSEQFTGLLVPLLWKKVYAPTLRGFQQMNEALKKRAEAA